MVNVNKNIVPGKSAEKTEEKAPMRRPRNKALNSSKKLPASVKDRRKQKLNCSRAEVINQLVNEEQIYTQEEAEELIDAFEEKTGATVERLATADEVDEYDGEFWATKDGVTKLWCRGDDGWYVKEEDYDSDGSLGVELADKRNIDSSCSGKSDIDSACGDKSELNSAADEKLDGVITLYDDFAKITEIDVEKLLKERVSKMVPGVDVSLEKINDTQIKVSGDCPEDEATRVKLAIESSDVTKSVDWDAKEAELDSSTKTTEKVEDDETAKDATEEVQKLNCSDEEVEDKVVVTESGNEVSIKEIKVVQNPSTNELALYVPENEDDEIPDGFVVLGDVVATAAAEAPEEEVEEAVDEEPEEGELDSSKKKN